MASHLQRSTVPVHLLALFALCLVATGGLAAQETGTLPRITYSKTLKGSMPEFLQVTVDANGNGTYDGRKLDDPPNPRPLRLSPTTVHQLFDLVGDLDNLKGLDVESHKRVANLGRKTITYQQGSVVNSVEFNYTLNRTAQELSDLFEKIAMVEEHISTLEFSIKYDHLSLPKELLQIQIELENKALADPELMVPTLEAIAKNPRFLHLAQARAQDILQRIQTSN